MPRCGLLPSLKMSSQSSETYFVVAIDLGTTFSGWAYSSSDAYRRNPEKICAKLWQSETVLTGKTPTCILICPDGKSCFKFGYDAQETYSRFLEEEKHEDYYYFEQFKTMLYQSEHEPLISSLSTSDGKKSLSALRVFTLAIQYLKDDAKNELMKHFGGKDISDSIRWVLTVPAISSDPAKRFMREAAVAAGIDNEKLTIALEPEAASIYCNYSPVVCSDTPGHLISFQPGQKYIVVDAGGGTVDISVHEVLENGQIRELHQASGGGWGGLQVHEQFSQFLVRIFGSDKIMSIKHNHFEDYMKLFHSFELKKKKVSPNSSESHIFTLSFEWIQVLGGSNRVITKLLQQSVYSESVKLRGRDKLDISDMVMKSFFEKATSAVVDHLRSNIGDHGADTVMLVGGFSESVMLQKAVREALPNMTVYVPQEAGLAVLKGAVIFGHDHSIIQERISRYTYGFELIEPFQKGFHLSLYKMKDAQNEILCKHVFKKIIERGKPVRYNQCVYMDTHYPTDESQDSIWFKLYASMSLDTKYSTDMDCWTVGDMEVKIRNKNLPLEERAFRVSVYTGGTEIKVRYEECSTGEITEAAFEYLSV